MDLLLEFQINERTLRQDRANLVREGSKAPIDWTYFIMPVRFRVSGLELFEMPPFVRDATVLLYDPGSDTLIPNRRKISSSPWVDLPLLHVAIFGLEAVQDAWRTGQAVYDLPEIAYGIVFSKSGSDVKICSTANNLSARVPYEELLQVFSHFAERVRQALIQEVPEVATHPIFHST